MLFRRIAIEIMPSRASPFLVVPLLVLACDKDKRKKPSTKDSGPTHDTGPDPDPSCDTGQLEDDGECVPAACGTGTWGNLEVDESTVYVDIAAAEGWDGSEAAPFTSIQAGLDAAGDVDGGMVAVAAGTYPETLELGRGHDGVHLAGRCKELVIVDASVGDEETPGIHFDAGSSQVEVSGVTLSGSRYIGLLVGAGELTIRESTVVGSGYVGIVAYQHGLYETSLWVESCEVSENTVVGVLVDESGATVTLRGTSIRDTRPDEHEAYGYGIDIIDGATLIAESCEVTGNRSAGVIASATDTTVVLRETSIQDTQPKGNGERGYGIDVFNGADLTMEACEVLGNTGVGVFAEELGTTVTLRETSIRDTQPDVDGWFGYGIGIHDGASLDAESCEVRGNTRVGVLATGSSTSVSLRETSIEDTQPDTNGVYGYGIEVSDGASLGAEYCEVRGNTSIGVLAADSGSTATFRETTIATTMRGEAYTVGPGIGVQGSATAEAMAIEVSWNEGPAFYVVGEDTHLTCTECTLSDNQFAGAVVAVGASLALDGSLIEDTTAQENLGGGVGIYSEPLNGGPPVLSISGSSIRNNPIAGLWLSGQGSYSFSGNTIHGGEGWTRESLTKCGDAVYARDGVTAWDGSSGLLLEDNELMDGLGAGLFLDDATATLVGNSYADNAVDLIVQGADCATAPDGYEDEAIGSAELCPTYDYATCRDEFALYLTLTEPESGYGAAFMRPGPPDPGTLHLPALPVALPHAFDHLPLLPPAPRVEPAEFRHQQLRHERTPPVPLVVPSTH